MLASDVPEAEQGVPCGVVHRDRLHLPGRRLQIVQDEPGRMRIRLVRGPEYRRHHEAELLEECHRRMGDRMDIELEYTSAIPRNRAGKFRAVINNAREARRYGD